MPGIVTLPPVERIKSAPPSNPGPIDNEPGQDGQGWDAGTFENPSPIGDDAGTFENPT